MPSRSAGRPKTAVGYHDDAMGEVFDLMVDIDRHIEMEQRHYRERRDSLNAMRARVRDGIGRNLNWAEVARKIQETAA